jgi:chaperonin GroEL (HSP60 family)
MQLVLLLKKVLLLVVVLHFKSKAVLSAIKSDNADEATGIQIISRAVESPLRTIVENAGLEGSVVVAKLLKEKVILDTMLKLMSMLTC